MVKVVVELTCTVRLDVVSSDSVVVLEALADLPIGAVLSPDSRVVVYEVRS
jgi:hypothetical protein